MIYKFKNRDLKSIENLELIPRLSSNETVNSLEIGGKLLYLLIQDNDGKQLIRIYNLKNGMQVGTVDIGD